MNYLHAIYAGIIIGLGASANLAVGGLPGAVIFSFALLMICALKYDLFTGKVGATVIGEYKPLHLIGAYLGNIEGIALVVVLVLFSPIRESITESATAIANMRLSNHWIANIIMGILCGMCVQLAVDGWKATKHPLAVMLPVVVFVVSKTNHCIADMFYFWISKMPIKQSLFPILCTTIGNIIGAVLMVADRSKLADDSHNN